MIHPKRKINLTKTTFLLQKVLHDLNSKGAECITSTQISGVYCVKSED